MLGLPQSTEVNRRVPKQKFYENSDVSPAVRRGFVEQIKGIWWLNKVAPETMNLRSSGEMREFEIFELRLNARALDEAVLTAIDGAIPYPILFLLSFEGQCQAWARYAPGGAKRGVYWHSEWQPMEQLGLRCEGLDVDMVWKNYLLQLAGEAVRPDETQDGALERVQRRQELRRQLSRLEGKLRRERQLNRKLELNAQCKALKRELDML